MKDQHTKNFHLSTIIRRRRNSIEFLKTTDGVWLNSREDIGNNMVEHFKQIYSSTNPQFPQDPQGKITPVITEEDNSLLCAIPDEQEIWEALKAIGSTKAPGPDRITALFFKHYWEIISAELIDSVRSFFISGFILKRINHTNITLISKSDNACMVGHYRPISLCNVTYKMISKILTHEIIHTMRRKKGQVGLMAIKADMEKAFDKMSCPRPLGRAYFITFPSKSPRMLWFQSGMDSMDFPVHNDCLLLNNVKWHPIWILQTYSRLATRRSSIPIPLHSGRLSSLQADPKTREKPFYSWNQNQSVSSPYLSFTLCR